MKRRRHRAIESLETGLGSRQEAAAIAGDAELRADHCLGGRRPEAEQDLGLENPVAPLRATAGTPRSHRHRRP